LAEAGDAASHRTSVDDFEWCADESVGYLMARVRSMMANETNQLTVLALDITSTQASMLLLLKRGALSGADLAREYGLDASAVTRILDKLEKRGLINRVRSSADRRVVNLALTDTGRQMVSRLKPLYAQALERMLAGFTQEEAGFLKSLLRRIIVNCEQPRTAGPVSGGDRT
jgi:DNA-binding MarR family transcriptional regulator